MQPWPDLRSTLAGIPWAIVGGVATRAYMPERTTQDMDILVHRADGPVVTARLEAAGFEIVSDLAIPGRAFRAPDGSELDVLFGDQPWLGEALDHPRADAAGYPVIDLPYLALLKLQAARAQDWADVARMLGMASPEQIATTRALVQAQSPVDLEDLDALIYLGRQELGESSEG